MLIEFSVTNYRSIREKQTLSMAASKYYGELKDQNCFNSGIPGVPQLVRSAVIYGPNASGKSNLLLALSFMQYMVESSAKEIQAGEKLDFYPFQLDRASKDIESEFEVLFIEDGVRYQYGFAVNEARVMREWLIAYPGRRPQRWFDREYNRKTKVDEYEFGPRFLGGRLRQDWKSATRGNALFLSVAVQFNSEQLIPIFNWFQKRLRVLSPNFTLNPGDTASACETEKGKKKVIKFLSAADLSIADIRIVKRKFTSDELPKELPGELREHFRKEMVGKEVGEIKFMHKNTETGDMVEFDPRDESDGTTNLFAFAGPWLDVIAHDKVLIVDEIDSSLHPLIVHELVRLMHQSGGKAQLVFTTHDTTILSQNIMRRDQIWFIEKNEAQASRLYPLSDFKAREKEALERGYLRGRYGAIPFIQQTLKL